MSGGTVLLISDIHTRYAVINAQIQHAEEATDSLISEVMILGDFGFFGDEMHDYFRRRKKRFLRPVACIEGNHEDHAALPDLGRRYADVVTHLARGTVRGFGPWRGLCLGGARYMDASSTPRGCEITDDDVAACLAHQADAVDMILSHDCPEGLDVPNTPGLEHYGAPGVSQMAPLAAHFRPRWWLFGHHHRWFDRQQDGTRYIGLPQSWLGYVLLRPDGEITMVQNEVSIRADAWWKRWFGRHS